MADQTPEPAPAPATVVELILSEGPIPLGEAAKILGPTARGKARSVTTMRRYCEVGMRGVRLEGFHGPSGWVTSAAAVRRFLARLNALATVPAELPGPAPAEPPPPPPARRGPSPAQRKIAELLRKQKEQRNRKGT